MIWIVLGVVLVVSLGGGVLAVRRGRARSALPSSDELVAELERALARTGRPVAGGTTLIALERRFHAVPTAASYVRALRLARFAGAARLPSVDERRALRTQLALGLGVVGRLRAWWALPPRFLGHRRALH